MKGLFLNGYYSTIGNIKLYLFVVLVSGAGLLVTGSPTAQELFVYLTITALSINAVVGARKDAASKWNRYEVTLPVRRRDIITCKYVAYLFWVVVGTVLALAVTAVAILLHKGANLSDGAQSLASMFALGIGISLLTGAVFYPFSYLVDVEKSETVLMISVFVAVGISIAAINCLNGFIASFSARMLCFVAFYLLVFFASRFLAIAVYQRKEL